MCAEKMEEETYSLIFKSLKHPIRRKILRMLVGKQMSFSEILNILSIDSGHLSYHIENLGELIRHSENGKYELQHRNCCSKSNEWSGRTSTFANFTLQMENEEN